MSNEQLPQRQPGENCDNCISYRAQIAIGQGLRCSDKRNKDSPVEGLRPQEGRFPGIPSRDFWCQHYHRDKE